MSLICLDLKDQHFQVYHGTDEHMIRRNDRVFDLVAKFGTVTIQG
jgi:hypothetical protein